MQVETRDGWIHYSSRRTSAAAGPRGTGGAVSSDAGTAHQPAAGTLEHFLTERYCLFTVDRAFRAHRLDIHHPPWPLQPAEAELTVNTMADAAGMRLPASHRCCTSRVVRIRSRGCWRGSARSSLVAGRSPMAFRPDMTERSLRFSVSPCVSEGASLRATISRMRTRLRTPSAPSRPVAGRRTTRRSGRGGPGAADGHELQHPVRHGAGRRQSLDRAARSAVRSRARAECRHHRRCRKRSTRQIREITAAAPGYAVVGVGRDDAQAKGEYSAILFRDRSAARRGVGHVLVFGHARGAGVEIVGEQHHAHLHVGAVHRSRRPRVLALQPAPGSPVATLARAQHRAAAPPHRRPRVSTRAGRRHGRFQRRRRQPRASRAGGRAAPGGRPDGGAVPRHVPRASTPTNASSARSAASSSGR